MKEIFGASITHHYRTGTPSRSASPRLPQTVAAKNLQTLNIILW